MDQNSQMLFGSINQELLGLPEFWCYFGVPGTIHYKMHTLIFKKMLIKYATLGVEDAVPSCGRKCHKHVPV